MVLESLSKPDLNTDYKNLVILRDITSPHDEIWICAREESVLLKKVTPQSKIFHTWNRIFENFSLKHLRGFDGGLQHATLS